MDYIFEFLARFWWIILFFVARAIISSITKKQRAGDSPKPASKVHEYLEKMRAEMEREASRPRYSDTDEVPSPFDDDGEMSPYLRKPAVPVHRVKVPPQPLFAQLESAPSSYPEQVPQAEPGLQRKPVSGKLSFPENLAYLPPLKRAVVLSEILGPPKGLG